MSKKLLFSIFIVVFIIFPLYQAFAQVSIKPIVPGVSIQEKSTKKTSTKIELFYKLEKGQTGYIQQTKNIGNKKTFTTLKTGLKNNGSFVTTVDNRYKYTFELFSISSRAKKQTGQIATFPLSKTDTAVLPAIVTQTSPQSPLKSDQKNIFTIIKQAIYSGGGGGSAAVIQALIPNSPSPTYVSLKSTNHKELLGITHADGKYRTTSLPFLDEGVKLVINTGVRTIGLWLNKDLYPNTDFGTNISDPVSLAKSAPFREAFSDPNIDTYILTVYGSGVGENIYETYMEDSSGKFKRSDYAEKEKQQYFDLTQYLETEFPNKKFILTDWELDWTANQSYNIEDIPTTEHFKAMISWLNNKHAGVVLGRGGKDCSTSNVCDAATFNLINKNKDVSKPYSRENASSDRPTVLNQVIPKVDTDMIGYSSWQSTNSLHGEALRKSILSDIATIRKFDTKNRSILITEFGFATGETAASDLETVANIFLEIGIYKALYWQIFDNACGSDSSSSSCVQYRLVQPDSSRTPEWFKIKSLIGAQNNALYLEQNLPQTLEPGKSYEVKVAFKNTGSLDWNFVNKYGFSLTTSNVENQNIWGVNKVMLPLGELVKGNETKVFTFNITAPETPGTYDLNFRMSQDKVESFGETSPKVSLQVKNPHITTPDFVPKLNGVQGYNKEKQTYDNKSAMPGSYLILYGIFAKQGNIVEINGKVLSQDYESDLQINVPIPADFETGTFPVKVKSGNKYSEALSFEFKKVAN